jgi:hypothetical protein
MRRDEQRIRDGKQEACWWVGGNKRLGFAR